MPDLCWENTTVQYILIIIIHESQIALYLWCWTARGWLCVMFASNLQCISWVPSSSFTHVYTVCNTVLSIVSIATRLCNLILMSPLKSRLEEKLKQFTQLSSLEHLLLLKLRIRYSLSLLIKDMYITNFLHWEIVIYSSLLNPAKVNNIVCYTWCLWSKFYIQYQDLPGELRTYCTYSNKLSTLRNSLFLIKSSKSKQLVCCTLSLKFHLQCQ